MIHRRGGRTVPNCSLGIWLRHPEQAHHDGLRGPPDPHGEEKPSMKIGKGPWPSRAGSRTPQISTNHSSQVPNPRPCTVKRRFEWSFRAAPHARLSAPPRAGSTPLQRAHVLRVQLCLPKHPNLDSTERGQISDFPVTTRHDHRIEFCNLFWP